MAMDPELRKRRVDSALEGVQEKMSMQENISIQEKMSTSQHSSHTPTEAKHGGYMQAWRMFLFAVYFIGGILFIFVTQIVGLPLYFYNQDYFYAYMAVTKRHFGILIVTMTQLWSPTPVRISGDESVRGQIRQTEDGNLECDFAHRMVLLANHQIYTDWVYLWWIAYTNQMHGHIYIILKESLRYIPILGTGMMLFGFVFLSRKWAKDKPRFQHRLRKLNTKHAGPLAGSPKDLDPMWLLIYPEGTNLSVNGRTGSTKWADKNGWTDYKHVLLPRYTGLQFCLSELKDTLEWVYDCTVGYEGIPIGEYGQDIFTLRSTYFQGQRPKSVNFHFRRFHISTIPIGDPVAFDQWLRDRWQEKDDLLQYFEENGRFPADEECVLGVESNGNPSITKERGYVNTEVRPRGLWEIIQIWLPAVVIFFIVRKFLGVWRWVTG